MPITGLRKGRKKATNKSMTGRAAARAWADVVTAEHCRDALARSAAWVVGLDINTNSTGYTVLHNPTGELAECGVIETKGLDDMFDKAMLLRHRLSALHSKYPTHHHHHHQHHHHHLLNATSAANDSPYHHPHLHHSHHHTGSGWVVGIEDFLKSFGGMQWRTSDIIKLACLNSIISYECWHIFYKSTSFVSVPLPVPTASPHSLDDHEQESSAQPRLAGLQRPFKVHPHQARSYFGVKKSGGGAAEEENVKAIGFRRVQHLFPPSHSWISKKRTGGLSEKNYDMVDSFMVAHYARKLGVEAALYADARLWQQFEATWMRACAPPPPPTSSGPSAAGVSKRRQRASEKAWQREREEEARDAFQQAIAEAAGAAFPAPS